MIFYLTFQIFFQAPDHPDPDSGSKTLASSLCCSGCQYFAYFISAGRSKRLAFWPEGRRRRQRYLVNFSFGFPPQFCVPVATVSYLVPVPLDSFGTGSGVYFIFLCCVFQVMASILFLSMFVFSRYWRHYWIPPVHDLAGCLHCTHGTQ